jgi:hypothetical protein
VTAHKRLARSDLLFDLKHFVADAMVSQDPWQRQGVPSVCFKFDASLPGGRLDNGEL